MGKKSKKLSTEEFMQIWASTQEADTWEGFCMTIRAKAAHLGKEQPTDRAINLRCARINAQIKKSGATWQYRRPKWIKRGDMTIAELLKANPKLTPDWVKQQSEEAK